MGNKIIPISIKDEEMIRYLNEKDNRSEYIRSLIKKDMERKKGLSEETKDLIISFIKENYRDMEIEKNDDGLGEFKDSIFDIFDK